MKIKYCFVSNSSSSSFILSIKKDKKIKVEIDLIDFIKECGDDYNGTGIRVIITTKEEVDDYFINHNCYKSIDELLDVGDEYEIETYNKMITEIDKGNQIIVCNIGNNKTDLFQVLKNNNNIKFIEEEWI